MSGKYILHLCEWGYCLTNGNESIPPNVGIAFGWSPVLIPLFMGLLIGFGVAWFWQEIKRKKLMNQSNTFPPSKDGGF